VLKNRILKSKSLLGFAFDAENDQIWIFHEVIFEPSTMGRKKGEVRGGEVKLKEVYANVNWKSQ